MKKKLLILSNSAFALVQFRRELIAELKKHDFEIICAVPNSEPDLLKALRSLGVRPVAYSLEISGINLLKEFMSIVSIFSIIKKIRPDRIICFHIKCSLYCPIAAFLPE
jgi:UDP-N-acetylglucosamine:LPS N-acetylglucosamine transferase